MNEVLTSREVCGRLRCGKSTVSRLFKSGELRGFRLGSDIRVYATSVEDYMRGRENVQPLPARAAVFPKKGRVKPAQALGLRFLKNL